MVAEGPCKHGSRNYYAECYSQIFFPRRSHETFAIYVRDRNRIMMTKQIASNHLPALYPVRISLSSSLLAATMNQKSSLPP
jgi:hypothetical protein